MNKEEHLQKLLDAERGQQWLVLANEYDALAKQFTRKAQIARKNYEDYKNGKEV